jgi:hypothetical protein
MLWKIPATSSPPIGFCPVNISKQQNAERVNVGLRSERLAQHLFGRHVVRRAQCESAPREIHAGRFGDPEVHQLDLAGQVEMNILGLDVAMNDLLRMDVVDRTCDLRRDF